MTSEAQFLDPHDPFLRIALLHKPGRQGTYIIVRGRFSEAPEQGLTELLRARLTLLRLGGILSRSIEVDSSYRKYTVLEHPSQPSSPLGKRFI